MSEELTIEHIMVAKRKLQEARVPGDIVMWTTRGRLREAGMDEKTIDNLVASGRVITDED